MSQCFPTTIQKQNALDSLPINVTYIQCEKLLVWGFFLLVPYYTDNRSIFANQWSTTNVYFVLRYVSSWITTVVAARQNGSTGRSVRRCPTLSPCVTRLVLLQLVTLTLCRISIFSLCLLIHVTNFTSPILSKFLARLCNYIFYKNITILSLISTFSRHTLCLLVILSERHFEKNILTPNSTEAS